MKQPWSLTLAPLLAAWAIACQAQQAGPWEVHGLNDRSMPSEFESVGNTNVFSNGVLLSNTQAIVTANQAMENVLSGVVVAEGDVTILDHGHIWRGTNFVMMARQGKFGPTSLKRCSRPSRFRASH